MATLPCRRSTPPGMSWGLPRRLRGSALTAPARVRPRRTRRRAVHRLATAVFKSEVRREGVAAARAPAWHRHAPRLKVHGTTVHFAVVYEALRAERRAELRHRHVRSFRHARY